MFLSSASIFIYDWVRVEEICLYLYACLSVCSCVYPSVCLSTPEYQVTPHGDLLVANVGVWASGEYGCSAHNSVLGTSVSLPTTTHLTVLPRTDDSPPAPPSFVTLRAHYTAHTGRS